MNFCQRLFGLILIVTLLCWGDPVGAASSSAYNSAKVNGVSIKYVTLDMNGNNIKPVVLNAQNQI